MLRHSLSQVEGAYIHVLCPTNFQTFCSLVCGLQAMRSCHGSRYTVWYFVEITSCLFKLMLDSMTNRGAMELYSTLYNFEHLSWLALSGIYTSILDICLFPTALGATTERSHQLLRKQPSGLHSHYNGYNFGKLGRLICPEGRVSSLNKCNPIKSKLR